MPIACGISTYSCHKILQKCRQVGGRRAGPDSRCRESIAADGYWLPVAALVRGGRGLWSCFVLSEPDGSDTFQVLRRDVEILQTERDRVLVRGTLQSGDRAIINGTHRLVPGQRVRLF